VFHSFKNNAIPVKRRPKNSDFATPMIPVSLEARERTQKRQLRDRRDSLHELTRFWEQPGSREGMLGDRLAGMFKWLHIQLVSAVWASSSQLSFA
jgi:hypothetical protein